MAQVYSLNEFAAKYEVMEDLGKGQYGIVAECAERISGRRFACKVVAARQQAITAAQKEVAALSLLKGCENIVTIEDVFVGEAGKGMVLVMELATGGDLLSRIEQKGRIPEHEARDMFKGLVMALKQCHDKGVIHRDVKPDNVLLFPAKTSPRISSSMTGRAACGFTVKLADFGIARMLTSGEKIDGYAGSFPYEAPEVLAGKEYDFSADIWSLGVTLYAMLSGKWPSFANNRRAFDESKDWDAPCWYIISSRAKDLIRRMLTTDPQIRPSVDEVLADRWVSGGFSLFSSSSSPSTPPRIPAVPAATTAKPADVTPKPADVTPKPADGTFNSTASSPKSVLEDPSTAFVFPLATFTIKTTYRTAKSCRKLASDVLRRKQWRRHVGVSEISKAPYPCCSSTLSRRISSSRSQRSSLSAASGRLSARIAAVAEIASADGLPANMTAP